MAFDTAVANLIGGIVTSVLIWVLYKKIDRSRDKFEREKLVRQIEEQAAELRRHRRVFTRMTATLNEQDAKLEQISLNVAAMTGDLITGAQWRQERQLAKRERRIDV